MPWSPADIEKMRRWRNDGVAFVREVFREEPDNWQAEALNSPAQRVVLQACQGPGKSHEMAWKGWQLLATREDANGAALSITKDNLIGNLWKELALLYQRSQLLQATFKMSDAAIEFRETPQTWWLQARAFPQASDPQRLASALLGLHGPYPFILLDEAGDMPPGVLRAADGIFANDVDAYLGLGGNPTSVDGALHEAAVTLAHRFHVIRISGHPDDPNRSKRVSESRARRLIEDWGEDSAIVLVTVKGEFPPVAWNKLLGPAEVQAAMRRAVAPDDFNREATVFGFDVAKMGDDSSVLMRRQGCVSFRARQWRKLETAQLADQAAMVLTEHPQYRAVFIDVTGGWGEAVYLRLKDLGFRHLVPVDFGSTDVLDERFLNRRAEMYWAMARWVKGKHCCLPNDGELAAELVAPDFGYATGQRRTKFKIQDKDEVKDKLGRSPDKADALALTFAAPVPAPDMDELIREHRGRAQTDFDPWEHMRRRA